MMVSKVIIDMLKNKATEHCPPAPLREHTTTKLHESMCKNKAYQTMVKQLQNNIGYHKKTVVSTPNILGRK
jgi:hypothetical protein